MYILRSMDVCTRANGCLYQGQWTYVLGSMDVCTKVNGCMY